jgi:hypothetical protein
MFVIRERIYAHPVLLKKLIFLFKNSTLSSVSYLRSNRSKVASAEILSQLLTKQQIKSRQCRDLIVATYEATDQKSPVPRSYHSYLRSNRSKVASAEILSLELGGQIRPNVTAVPESHRDCNFFIISCTSRSSCSSSDLSQEPHTTNHHSNWRLQFLNATPTDSQQIYFHYNFPKSQNMLLWKACKCFTNNQVYPLTLKITDSKFCGPEFPKHSMTYEECHGAKNDFKQHAHIYEYNRPP